MFEPIDLYCERTSSAFWAEPVNALTNVLFLVSAWFIWRRAKKMEAVSSGVWLLLVLMCAIGIGSFLFHTFAITWARWVDVLPILFFQLLYAWLYCREIARIHFTYALAILLAYCVAAFVGRQFPHVLNGSLIYAPAMVFLVVLGIYHLATRRMERYIVLTATGVFFVALISRTVDTAVCPHFLLGTHFMWHVCNALVLYLMMRGLL
ncbi:MAG: ceramidase domain-containing protein [Verrucomicrobia bacterium]|nr:ceramidase domain-containing protein [Verrucomicrobiota bacterium]